ERCRPCLLLGDDGRNRFRRWLEAGVRHGLKLLEFKEAQAGDNYCRYHQHLDHPLRHQFLFLVDKTNKFRYQIYRTAKKIREKRMTPRFSVHSTELVLLERRIKLRLSTGETNLMRME